VLGSMLGSWIWVKFGDENSEPSPPPVTCSQSLSSFSSFIFSEEKFSKLPRKLTRAEGALPGKGLKCCRFAGSGLPKALAL